MWGRVIHVVREIEVMKQSEVKSEREEMRHIKGILRRQVFTGIQVGILSKHIHFLICTKLIRFNWIPFPFGFEKS
jgi:acid phosphatase family membrane protein YuiD